MSAEHWDAQAKTDARAAVWSEPDYEDSVAASIAAIEQGPFGAFLNTHAGLEVLEIGCGIGRVLIPLAQRTPRNHFHGQDISIKMLQRAQAVPSFADISWWLDDIPSTLDAVYSMLVFQHLPGEKVAEYFTRIGKALRPSGLFRFQFVEGDYHVDHDHRHSLDDVVAWLHAAGMKAVNFDEGLVHDDWTWVTAVKP